MKILLLQLDGKLPNIDLMRICAHHQKMGDTVEYRAVGNLVSLTSLTDCFDKVYASLVFDRTRPLAEKVQKFYPQVILGGTGWNIQLKLEDIGIETKEQDYSIYPAYKDSIGFTQRGCRLRCKFCCVPEKEGPVSTENRVADIWRGGTYPRHLLLLDNDFFGQENWQEHIDTIRTGNFK